MTPKKSATAKPTTKAALKEMIKTQPGHTTVRWNDLAAATFKPEEIAEAKAEAQAFAREQTLRELREFAGKTQAQVSEATAMSQGAVSLVERREDHLLSTLRSYVQALGGELEVVARFGDKSIRLKHV